MNQPLDKEFFHVAGDMPDPAGTGLRGQAPGYNLTAGAIGRPQLFYRTRDGRDLVIEADIYKLDDEPMYAHLICPICAMVGQRNNALRIRQDHKQMSYEPAARVPTPPGWTDVQIRRHFPRGLGGLFSCESFGCSWEVTPELRREFGLAVCPWRVVIENNVVRDA